MTTHRLLTDFQVCVPESQVADYANVVPREKILPHPDSVRGLAPKLNWILKRFEDVPMMTMDDDILSFSRCFVEIGEAPKITDPEMIHLIVDQTALMAADCGAFLFGFQPNQTGVRFYTGLKPFAMTGLVLGAAMGFLPGHGLRNDERLVGKMDYDLSAMNALRHRYLFRNDRYCCAFGDTFTAPGGQANCRTTTTEQRDLEVLVRKWGLVERGGVIKTGGSRGLRKADYAGITKVTLHLPF